MALKPRFANLPKIDENGFVNAEIVEIVYCDAEESEYEKEQLLFNFIADGVRKSINFKLWTGTVISPEKYDTGKTTDYNKLTKLLLNLKVLDLATLKKTFDSGKDCDIDIESLVGIKVQFKLKKAKQGLSTIDLDTIKTV
jgi:hypothetical protein